jgi:exodeoxyribonuclease VII small subunit
MAPSTETRTFEQCLGELERIVRDLEDGKTGLDESLRRFEQGVGLLKSCYGQLRQAELRIVELVGVDENGEPRVRPFDHAASVREAKT